VNVFGLAADLRAAAKLLKGADPQLAKELRAHQFGGLLIGGRGAGVHRTAEDLPRILQKAGVVRHLPVVQQLGDLAHGALNSFFRANRLIEGVAQRAAFGRSVRQDIQAFTGSWTQTLRLGEQAVAEVRKGLHGTATQERFIRAQHELLGQYEGFSPAMRELVQGPLPFLPWALAAARFVFWTMPVHHTTATALLLRTEGVVDKEWQQQHKNLPPGSLRFGAVEPGGGIVDFARYTPYGFSIPLTQGDFQGVTGLALPQLQGAAAALEGRDPFGRDLAVPKTRGNPTGKATGGQKALIALNSLAEAVVPGLAYARRLQEHGATPYATSTVFAPQTKPGTAHGRSALQRSFNPFSPVFLHGGGKMDLSKLPAGVRSEVKAALRESRQQQAKPDPGLQSEIRSAVREALAASRSGR
jgi:hypothetical protein